jgi:Ca-activated chloride channel homolog
MQVTVMKFFLPLVFAALVPAGAIAQGAEGQATVLVLDASGSMWAQLPEGRSRIEVARDVLDDFLRARSAATPLGVIAYGHTRKGDCGDIAVVAPVAVQDGGPWGPG